VTGPSGNDTRRNTSKATANNDYVGKQSQEAMNISLKSLTITAGGTTAYIFHMNDDH
jgi:hypothetical protein